MEESVPPSPAPPVMPPSVTPPAAGQAPSDPPKKDAPKPRMFTSLSEIVEAETKAPSKPQPILVQWELPVSDDDPTGVRGFVVETRFSSDPWKFGLRYINEVSALLREEKADEKGVMQKTHPNADFVACAREVVVSPIWLHNESAVAKLKDILPPPVFSGLKVDLELAAGLNADFFGRYAVKTVPTQTLRSIDSGHASGSDSPPGALETPAP